MRNHSIFMTPRLSIWQTLTVAPHRSLFLLGTLQGIAVMLWWLADLAGRYGGLFRISWTIPAPAAHAYLMIYGFFPLFIFGFLFTTYPAWLNTEKIPRQRYINVFLLMTGGHLLFYTGLALSSTLVICGVTLVLAAWGLAVVTLGQVVLRVAHPDKRHAYATAVALLFGWIGLAAFAVGLWRDEPRWLAFASLAGIWLFLLPIVFTVSHRMIPFFSSSVLNTYTVIRPYGLLWLGLAAMAMHALLSGSNSRWLWIPDLLLTLTAFYLAFLWQFWRSLKVRLLAVLHLSFLWLGIGAALSTAQGLAVFRGAAPVLGWAPLHALAIGYAASMILAMASRVTLGHSGRALVADQATWLIFVSFQGAVIARIAFELLPDHSLVALYTAAAIWLGCYGAWAYKYAPYFWQPRIDGRDG